MPCDNGAQCRRLRAPAALPRGALRSSGGTPHPPGTALTRSTPDPRAAPARLQPLSSPGVSALTPGDPSTPALPLLTHRAPSKARAPHDPSGPAHPAARALLHLQAPEPAAPPAPLGSRPRSRPSPRPRRPVHPPRAAALLPPPPARAPPPPASHWSWRTPLQARQRSLAKAPKTQSGAGRRVRSRAPPHWWSGRWAVAAGNEP